MEMVIVGIVAIVLFGSKLPEVARNLGRSYNQFRAGMGELKSSLNAQIPDLNTDTMPRHEKIRHFSDVDPVIPNVDPDDGIPLFSPPSTAAAGPPASGLPSADREPGP